MVPGPGLLNAGAALATAFGCNTPVLCITGQIPSRFIGKGYGILHEVTDQMEALRSVTKEQLPITGPSDVPDVISDAIGTALSGRRGPVVGIFGQQVERQLLDNRRHVVAMRRQRRHGRPPMQVKHRQRRVGPERRHAGQQLEQHGAE